MSGTTNVEETVPPCPTDTVVVVNGVVEQTASGRSATQTELENVLQVGSGPSGQPVQSGLVSITNLPPSALQTFRYQ
jgi:hypothetical protein